MAWCRINYIKGNMREHSNYIENSWKTANPDYVPTTEDQEGNSKEQMEYLISGVNCNPDSAPEEFQDLLDMSSKEKKIVNKLYAAKQSFKEGEVTPQQAHDIGVELAQRLWGDNFKVVVTTHTNTKHIHNHFAICSVGLDGKRINNDGKLKWKIREESDWICREHNLSVIKLNKKRYRYQNYGEWLSAKNSGFVNTHKGLLRYDIDNVIDYSRTEEEFFQNLRKLGYRIKISSTGKTVSVFSDDWQKATRIGKSLGEGYTMDDIRQRIEEGGSDKPPFMPYGTMVVYRIRSMPIRKRTNTKYTGLVGMIIRYGYMMGVYPKYNRSRQKWIPPKLRGDIQKLQKLSDELRILVPNDIKTFKQLYEYQKTLNERIDRLCERRDILRAKAKSAKTPEEKQELKEKISEFTSVIRDLRYKDSLCDDIADNNVKRLKAMKEQRNLQIEEAKQATKVMEKEELNEEKMIFGKEFLS